MLHEIALRLFREDEEGNSPEQYRQNTLAHSIRLNDLSDAADLGELKRRLRGLPPGTDATADSDADLNA
jgi:hypothetical protein